MLQLCILVNVPVLQLIYEPKAPGELNR
jgi:hypothetical protein